MGEKIGCSESLMQQKYAKIKRREKIMKNNQINVPQAKQAMEQFKMQAASEVGVNLTNGYNGHLTSREAGSVGGQMVKKMIWAYEQGLQYCTAGRGELPSPRTYQTKSRLHFAVCFFELYWEITRRQQPRL